ncbi:MAG: hypothetical protein F6K54_19615 [Okeania sp. SIO3B5]|uniref:hypothetical protein n=1 Tax=Okeania sp. SIO3B5 TaxID=2607811 RepID=UPI0013FF05B4|nr:hypothetical protein [Okeania sp. SIO3B5]NEO55089.1 hypothetical protein [Okeania sp. SIO3B5]
MSDTNDNSKLQEKLELLKQGNSKDKFYNAGKAIVSAIPSFSWLSIGSLAVPFYEHFIKDPSSQRLHDFLEEVVQNLYTLEQQCEAVSFDNPTFQTTFKKAIRIAECEHQQEKLEALRNAVLNSAIPNSLKDDIQVVFLKWIDEFTVSHIRLLRMLHYIDNYNEEEFLANLPDLEENRIFYNQVLLELRGKGLIKLREVYETFEEEPPTASFIDDAEEILKQETDEIESIISDLNPFQARRKYEKNFRTVKHTKNIDKIISNVKHNSQKSITTELGKQFIEFIENPLV